MRWLFLSLICVAQVDAGSARRVVIGHSIKKRPINLVKFGNPKDPIALWISAAHGNEGATVTLTKKFITYLEKNPKRRPRGVQLWIIPVMNPDGYLKKARRNARQVDLNRNFGSKNWKSKTRVNKTHYKAGGGKKPFSEPETRAVRDLVKKNRKKIKLFINMHCCGNVIIGAKKSKRAMGYEKVFLRYLKMRTLKKTWSKAAYPVTGTAAQWMWEKYRIPELFFELPKKKPVNFKSFTSGILAVFRRVP